MDRSWMPTLAGILNLISGAAALFGFMALAFAAAILGHIPDQPEEMPLHLVQGFLGCLAFLVLALALTAIAGGVFAILRRRWLWMLVGSIAATLICAPLGVPAVILTALAERDFRQASAETPEA